MLRLATYLLIAVIGQSTNQNTYEYYFDQAEKAKSKSDYASMEANLTKAFEKGPGNEYAWRSLAWAQMNQGKWKESLASANENIKRNGLCTWSLKQLFASAIAAGDLQLARKAVTEEADLPESKRNEKMIDERRELDVLTWSTTLNISWKIVVKDYELQDGALYIQPPLSNHIWQKCKTKVEGVKDWKFVKDKRYEMLIIKPGDVKEFNIVTQITHKPRVIGYKALEKCKSWDIPESEKKYLTNFINGNKYDIHNPLIQAMVPQLKGKSAAETVQNVLDWLGTNMRYEFDHGDSIEEMLSSHRGVCHHYANLLTTLCRACGVPAMVCHGSAMPKSGSFKDTVPSHGWAEVYIPEFGWIPVEPLSANSLRVFSAAGYVVVDATSRTPDDNHFEMKTDDGHHLQSIQGAPATGTAKQ
jgi:tetratricopeptide (TPR) repeat protein